MSARAEASRGYRMKPAPRRSRGRATRIHWDKLGRVVLVLVLFATLASYINPVVNFLDAWRDTGAERAQLRDLEAQNRQLRAKAGTIGSPDAAERAARRLGMVAPTEAPYTIKD